MRSDGSVRLIHDCIRLSGEALNDYAELERTFKFMFILWQCLIYSQLTDMSNSSISIRAYMSQVGFWDK